MDNESNIQITESQGNSLTLIPLIVWKFIAWVIALIFTGSFLTILYYHHTSMGDFLESEVTVFLWFLRMIGAILCIVFIQWVLSLLYRGYKTIHTMRIDKSQRQALTLKVERQALQNEMLRQQVEVTRQLPALIQYAINQGHNIEISPKLDIKVQNFLSNVHTLGNGQAGQQLLTEATDYLPEPYTMSDVLQTWQPTKDGILLAKGRDLITVPIGEPLCHTTFTGNTDAGKTNNERMILIQLAFLQQCIYLCDRNYQPFREDRKLGIWYDYRPIEVQLAHEPIVETRQAVALLSYLYSIVEDRRMERRKVQSANAIVPFKDIYLVFDELPAFASEDKAIMVLIGRLLREARQYGVFFIGAAQDLLNQTLQSDNGAIRDNLLTNYYGGGDMTTARLVLNLAKGEKIDESGLGKLGVTYLRAKGADIEHVKARTPLSDDMATRMLLGDMSPVQYVPFPVVESVKPYTTQPLREQIAYPYTPGNTPVMALEPLPGKSESESELQQVVTAWNEGYRSIGKVMERTGLGQNRSRVLIAQAKNKGLIGE